MVTTREALGKIIWEASRADESTISVTGANIVADALLAAGCTLPRTVSTAEELDALPVDAVVLSDGTAYQKGGHRFWFGEGSTWSNAGVFLPATVLYTPEVTA